MNQPTEVIVERQITRANGTVEPCEEVAYWSRNPLRRIARRLRGVNGKVKLHARSRFTSS